MRLIRHPIVVLADGGGWSIGHARSWSWDQDLTWSDNITMLSSSCRSWSTGTQWSLWQDSWDMGLGPVMGQSAGTRTEGLEGGLQTLRKVQEMFTS